MLFESFELGSNTYFIRENKPFTIKKNDLKDGFFNGTFITYVENTRHYDFYDNPEKKLIEPNFESVFENGELKLQPTILIKLIIHLKFLM